MIKNPPLYFKAKKRTKHSRIVGLHFLFILGVFFYGVNSFSQDLKQSNSVNKANQELLEVHSLSQLATHNYQETDISKKVDWKIFYPNYSGGMEKLQLEIKTNPSKFPLQELEDKSNFEPDAFRRWEYQMRKMPVKIISPNSNLLDVSFKIDDNITFCETTSFDLVIDIKNTSGSDLPNFYFIIKKIPGAVINYRKLKLPRGVSFVRSSNTFTFNEGFKKDAVKKINLTYNLGCDGRGGSPILKGKSKIHSKLNWKMNLIGYLLDYNNKELYKVIDFGNSSKTIQFNKQTKY
jgi:hypothetical protein